MYRGIATETGRMIYGNLIMHNRKSFIARGMDNLELVEVRPDTVGQYTGFDDTEGEGVYEGDILESSYEDAENNTVTYEMTVWWDEKELQWAVDVSYEGDDPLLEPLVLTGRDTEVIGNIHQ